MKKDFKFNLNDIKTKANAAMPYVNKHIAFAAIFVVLLTYLLVVWHISTLATAEPSESDLKAAESSSSVPKIDNKAIQQIQSLEQNSAQVQALFNQARNNPFHE